MEANFVFTFVVHKVAQANALTGRTIYRLAVSVTAWEYLSP